MSLFQPFRAMGYITDDVPFAIQRRGKETFVTVSIGNAWQVYNTAKLTIAVMGPQFSRRITSLACRRDSTFAAIEGGSIVECVRVHQRRQLSGVHSGRVVALQVLGSTLLSLSSDGLLAAWALDGAPGSSEPVVTRLPCDFVPAAMAHPDTYLNKVVVGSQEGRLVLVNFDTAQIIYEFARRDAGICCLAPSPALDVLGVGLSDGTALALNLKTDTSLFSLADAGGAGGSSSRLLSGSEAAARSRSSGRAIRALAFSSGASPPLLAAAGDDGAIALWDLERLTLAHVLPEAHDAPVRALHFFAGSALLQSAGGDNALKQWLVEIGRASRGAAAGGLVAEGEDGVDAGSRQRSALLAAARAPLLSSPPRLVRFRSGHAAPPTLIRHYGDGRRLLSAGSDRAFRLFAAHRDQQSCELSQRQSQSRARRLGVQREELLLPRVVSLDSCPVRERDWANVLTAHAGHGAAYVWRLRDGAIGEHVLRPPARERRGAPRDERDSALALDKLAALGAEEDRRDDDPVRAVALSRCGNFGFLGAQRGGLHRFNMQSGLYRGEYCRPGEDPAHDGPVVGVAPDASNAAVVSAGADGFLRLWDFKKRSLIKEIALPAPAAQLVQHEATGLVAVACEDNGIYVYDVQAQGLVRRFLGHVDRVTDLQFNRECDWLLSSSMDGTVRVWSVPGARVLRVMELGPPVTSLSLAPSGDVLATAHVGLCGIYMWSNQQLFGAGDETQPSKKVARVPLPTAVAELDDAGAYAPQGRTSAAPDALRHTRAPASEAASDSEGSESDTVAWEGADVEEEATSSSEEESSSSESEDEVMAAAEPSPEEASLGPAPVAPEMVTLSLLPRAQWQSLLHWEAIRARSKPLQPPKKPEAAPFFLPTVTGAAAGRKPVWTDAQEEGARGEEEEPRVRRAAMAAWGGEDEGEAEQGKNKGSKKRKAAQPAKNDLPLAAAPPLFPADSLAALLLGCRQAGDWTSALSRLRSLAPAALDAGLLSLTGSAGGSEADYAALGALLAFLEAQLRARTNYDWANALLGASLRLHAEELSRAGSEEGELAREVVDGLAGVEAALEGGWETLDVALSSARCAVGLLAGIQQA